MCLMRGWWGWFATCGSPKGRRSLLGNFASLILSWTVASAVFDALDIVATYCYEDLSRPAIVSSIFSFFSIWYGLVQRRHDFDDLSKMGAKRRKPRAFNLEKMAKSVGTKMGSVGHKMGKVSVALRERARTRGQSSGFESDGAQLIELSTTQSPVQDAFGLGGGGDAGGAAAEEEDEKKESSEESMGRGMDMMGGDDF